MKGIESNAAITIESVQLCFANEVQGCLQCIVINRQKEGFQDTLAKPGRAAGISHAAEGPAACLGGVRATLMCPCPVGLYGHDFSACSYCCSALSLSCICCCQPCCRLSALVCFYTCSSGSRLAALQCHLAAGLADLLVEPALEPAVTACMDVNMLMQGSSATRGALIDSVISTGLPSLSYCSVPMH